MKSVAGLGKQPDGNYLVPTNQLLRPWGEQTMIAGRPVDMAFDSGKRILAILNTRGINVVDGSTGTRIATIAAHSTSYAGIAFRPGDRELWASETSNRGDSILITPFSENGMPGEPARIDIPNHAVPVGIAFSADGKTAYVALSRANSLAIVDAASRTITRQIDVGMAPFGVAASKVRGKIYVTNRGGRRPAPNDVAAPSSGSKVLTDPVTGSSVSGTLSVVDAETLTVREVPVGLAPSQLTLSPDDKSLVVANGHSDTISVLNTETLARTDLKIPTFPDAGLGSQPIASVFAPDGKTLYVACGGNNAIAVVILNGKTWKVAGAVPTAWFPTALALGREGRRQRSDHQRSLATPPTPRERLIRREYIGSSRNHSRSHSGTGRGRHTRGGGRQQPRLRACRPGIANLSSLGIEHVFLIVKENPHLRPGAGRPAQSQRRSQAGDVRPRHHAQPPRPRRAICHAR